MPHAHFIAFSAQTRMSGVDVDGRKIRKGAADAVRNFAGGRFPADVEDAITRVSSRGGPPWSSRTAPGSSDGAPEGHRQGGLSDRFERFRAMGIRT